MSEPEFTVLAPADLSPLLALVVAPVPAPLSADEMRWEDDGGPVRPARDGYEHFWNAPVRTVAFEWVSDDVVSRARGPHR